MPTPPWQWRLVLIAAVVLTALIGLGVHIGRGDPFVATVRAADAEDAKHRYVGSGACKGCHEAPGDRPTDYVYLTEYTTWSKKDKHSQAYKKLSEERSLNMVKILGLKKPATEEPKCLNCHATNVPMEQWSNDFKISDGVSCDACHGPASSWFAPHFDKTWRTKPIAEKEKLGMYDVRDPVKLSRLCVSCHVGSVAEGKIKIVTHAMYAAGHPPLPSINVATFCDNMPPHWRYLNQKPVAVQQVIRSAFNIPKDELERTKLTALSSVVTFQAYMELLGHAADAAKKKDAKDWPELANYDCYACHHELKTPSWRQKRGYAGRPGRPPMQLWPTILLEDALRSAEDSTLTKQYDERLSKLRQAFDARPFGEAKEIAERAGQMKEWSDRLLQQLLKKDVHYNSAMAHRMLRGLCAVKDADKLDYDSASQTAWAIEVILKEVKPSDLALRRLKELHQTLKLDLPSGTNKEILSELPAGLHIRNEYDPAKFKSSLEKLCPLLPRE